MAYASDYFGHDTPKLGFGLMRLPKCEDGTIDVNQVKEMVDVFMEAGLTYFDTAYVYDGGGSEKAAREALVERHDRESFTIATKANAWLGRPTADEVRRQLDVSMERMGIDYVDFYLLHAIQTNNIDKYDSFGLWDWIQDMKRRGRIRHAGFSFHADSGMLDRLLTAHPEVDFIQLQVNYADWEAPTVQSRENIEVAKAHGVPYVIMEPIKGGLLANPPASVAAVFDEANATLGTSASYASWAVRFAASQPGVITVLSGMSTLAQVEDNVSYMADFKPMTDFEMATALRANAAFEAIDQIKCTECHYCMDGCPMGIPIPDFFADMNRELIFGNHADAKRRYDRDCADAGVTADDCIGCLQCEGACPQGLPITTYLGQIAEVLSA